VLPYAYEIPWSKLRWTVRLEDTANQAHQPSFRNPQEEEEEVMPSTWGTDSPADKNKDNNYFDTQYVKFFEQHGFDFDLLRKAGQWKVVLRQQSKDDNGHLILFSESSDSLSDALVDVYRTVKKLNKPPT
jgi:hypothetical protein